MTKLLTFRGLLLCGALLVYAGQAAHADASNPVSPNAAVDTAATKNAPSEPAEAAAATAAVQGQHQPGKTSPGNGAAAAAVSNADAAATGYQPDGSAGSGQSGATPQATAHVGAAAETRNHMDTGSKLIHQSWPFQGVFGTYDHAALQRGFQVYKQVCSACHSMNQLSYRNLEEIGYSEGQVKAIASQYQVDHVSDSGDIVQKPATPADHFHAPFANKQAAQAANNGAAPPDMSLLVKAREGGADYIYSILMGYTTPPEGVKVLPGQYYNTAIVGHIIAMPPPLTTDGQVSYDGFASVSSTKEQNARDVAQFLMWASEPHLEQRKKTGVTVMIFLLVLTLIAYLNKRRVWKDVHH